MRDVLVGRIITEVPDIPFYVPREVVIPFIPALATIDSLPDLWTQLEEWGQVAIMGFGFLLILLACATFIGKKSVAVLGIGVVLSIAFTQTANANPTATFTLPIQQTAAPDVTFSTPPGATFNYRLTPEDTDMFGAPVEFSITGTGTFQGPTLTFDRFGVFRFTLERICPPRTGWTVDDRVFVIDVYFFRGQQPSFVVNVLDEDGNLVYDDDQKPANIHFNHIWLYAHLEGYVTCATTGAPIPGATVTVEICWDSVAALASLTGIAPASQVCIELTMQTDQNGFFRFENVPPGTASLTATHPDFFPNTRTGLPILGGVVNRHDIELTHRPIPTQPTTQPPTIQPPITTTPGGGIVGGTRPTTPPTTTAPPTAPPTTDPVQPSDPFVLPPWSTPQPDWDGWDTDGEVAQGGGYISPQTGDDSNPALWTMLVATSSVLLVAIIVVAVKTYKKPEEDIA